jgi:hypothetical protein
MDTFAPETCHYALLENAPRTLAFSPAVEYPAWRAQVDATLRQLAGVMPEPVPLDIRVEYELRHEEYTERRIIFSSEPYADVPCHLLLPNTKRGPYPVVICVQGHSTGMHISLGRPKFPGDAESIAGGRDFAVQAVREGYAALALEQRCFGEREDRRPAERRSLDNRCHHASMTALLLGRTMIGERVWDVSRAIDMLATFPEIDTTMWPAWATRAAVPPPSTPPAWNRASPWRCPPAWCAPTATRWGASTIATIITCPAPCAISKWATWPASSPPAPWWWSAAMKTPSFPTMA